MTKYFETWWMIMVRPIYFYTKLKEEDWQKKALTYLLVSSWDLAFFATIVIFLLQYGPIGSTLVEGVSGFKFLVILPVLFVLMFVFFMITFLILGGLFSLAFFVLLFLVGGLLHYVYHFLGGKGSLNHMLQSTLYSSAVLMMGLVILLFMTLVKYMGIDFVLFRGAFDFVYLLMLVYWYGLWAIAGRKAYGVSKSKAFLGAIVPIIALLLLGLIFDKIAIPKLQPWIS